MSYIENIRKNVSNIFEIKKIALIKKTNFQVAKIMFHKGKKDIDQETAQKIMELINNLKVPVNVADVLDLTEDYQTRNSLDLSIVYEKISMYTNRKYLKELSPYIWAEHYYGQKIFELIQKGFTLKEAVQIFEIKVKKEMKDNGLSEVAALAKLLYYGDNNSSKIFEKQYEEGKAIPYSPSYTIIHRIIYSNEYKVKKVHGIILASQTDEGLNKMVDLIEDAYSKGNPDFLKKVSSYSEKHNLFLTDFSITTTASCHYSRFYKYIYMNPNYIPEAWVNTFFHEATHFLDNQISAQKTNDNRSYLSINNPVIIKLLEKISKKTKPISRGISMCYFINLNAKKYSKDKALNQKWLNELKEKFPTLTERDIGMLMQQKRMYERKKYLILYSCITDIFDGLKNGFLYSYLQIPGHGKEYYSNKESVYIEFIAEIGELYNSDSKDILIYEFGEELANELFEMYKGFIENENISEYVTSGKAI